MSSADLSTTRSPRTARAVVAVAVAVTAGAWGLAAWGGDSAAGGRAPAPPATPTSFAASSTASADAASITFMREEEKLARDVYAVLAAKWGLPTFTNIAAAEQQHMDAVATLLTRAGIPDPAAGSAPGEFRDRTLQALYDEFVARGTSSVEEALRVGALIEEVDIVDLEARTSSDPAVQAVFDRLEAGSENHLRAFVRALARRGVTYDAVRLPIDRLATILADASGRRSA